MAKKVDVDLGNLKSTRHRAACLSLGSISLRGGGSALARAWSHYVTNVLLVLEEGPVDQFKRECYLDQLNPSAPQANPHPLESAIYLS